MKSKHLKKYTAAALAVMVCCPLFPQSSIFAASKAPYTDIASSFAKEEITELYNSNIMKGTTDSLFSPKKAITRAEFVTVLNRLLNLQSVDAVVNPFKDVSKSAWYYESVMAAFQLDLATGTSENEFAPSQSITRQEAATLLVRAMKQEADASSSELSKVKDKNSIASWAEDAVAKAYELELMEGDSSGNFRPKDAITREEAAVIIARILDNKDWSGELKSTQDEAIQLAWQYGQTTAEFEKSVASSPVNTLSPRWYFINEQGKITDNTDKSLVTWAKAKNKKVWAMVGNRSDLELTHKVLSDTTSRNAAVTNLAGMVDKYGLDGLNIDFENVGASDKSYMTTFVQELATALKKKGAELSINVSPDLGTDWTEAFDYEAIGKSADYIVLMCYDEHWGGSSTAGSVSSLGYVKNSLKTLEKAVDSDKVILALPFYTRDWTLNSDGSAASSASITLNQQQTLMASYSVTTKWNATSGQYVGTYKKNNVKHSIWMEDGRSFSRKLEAAADYDIAGLAYWYMGAETSDMWSSINNANTFYGYDFN